MSKELNRSSPKYNPQSVIRNHDKFITDLGLLISELHSHNKLNNDSEIILKYLDAARKNQSVLPSAINNITNLLNLLLGDKMGDKILQEALNQQTQHKESKISEAFLNKEENLLNKLLTKDNKKLNEFNTSKATLSPSRL